MILWSSWEKVRIFVQFECTKSKLLEKFGSLTEHSDSIQLLNQQKRESRRNSCFHLIPFHVHYQINNKIYNVLWAYTIILFYININFVLWLWLHTTYIQSVASFVCLVIHPTSPLSSQCSDFSYGKHIFKWSIISIFLSVNLHFAWPISLNKRACHRTHCQNVYRKNQFFDQDAVGRGNADNTNDSFPFKIDHLKLTILKCPITGIKPSVLNCCITTTNLYCSCIHTLSCHKIHLPFICPIIKCTLHTKIWASTTENSKHNPVGILFIIFTRYSYVYAWSAQKQSIVWGGTSK